MNLLSSVIIIELFVIIFLIVKLYLFISSQQQIENINNKQNKNVKSFNLVSAAFKDSELKR
jgi:hypothetical protein